MKNLPDTTWLDATWMQSGVDALREALDVSPALKTRMVTWLLESGLWDKEKLSYDAAMARFNACLNPSRSEFFKISEVVALSIAFERPQFLLWMAARMGFEVRRLSTIEQQNGILERLAKGIEDHNHLVAECQSDLRRLGAPMPAMPIHPAIRESQTSAFRFVDDSAEAGKF